MKIGDILICIEGSATGRKRSEIAFRLAARSRARVTGYYVASQEALLGAPKAEAMDAAAAEFERLLNSHGLDGTWILGSESRTTTEMIGYSRCVDLVVVGLGVPDDPALDPQGLDVEQLVVECGRPVLGIPVVNISADIGQNILVAWDGSRESTRALHDAIPFLRDAAMVKIVSIDSDRLSVLSPDSVAAHLKRLGIAAAVDDALNLQLPVGEEILSRIEREKADLLVAGAFGHSRVREHLFGGASRTLLNQMMVPVLVSH